MYASCMLLCVNGVGLLLNCTLIAAVDGQDVTTHASRLLTV